MVKHLLRHCRHFLRENFHKKMLPAIEFWQRVHYVAFKRAVWMFETVSFFITCALLLHADFSPGLALLLLSVAALRWFTEAINYNAVAQHTGVRDAWGFLYPFG